MPEAWGVQTANFQKEEVGWASSYPGAQWRPTACVWKAPAEILMDMAEYLHLHHSAWREYAFFLPWAIWLHCALSIFGDFILWFEGFQSFAVWGFFFFPNDIWEVWFYIIKPKVIYLSNLGNHSVYSILLYVTRTMKIVNVNHGGQIGKDYGLRKCNFTLRIVLGWKRKCKSCPFTLWFYIF